MLTSTYFSFGDASMFFTRGSPSWCSDLYPGPRQAFFLAVPHWVECQWSYCLFTILLRALHLGEFKFKCVCVSYLTSHLGALPLSTLSPCLENWGNICWNLANALISASKWASVGFAHLSGFLFALSL